MPTNTWTVSVQRPPEEVFAYLIDIDRHGEWSPKAYTVEPLTDGPLAVGSRYRSSGWLPRDPNHVNEVEITKVDPPSRFGFTAWDRGLPFTSEFVLTRDDGGTRIDRVMDMPKPSGALGLAYPLLFKAVIRPGIQKGMDMLKQRLDAGA